MSLCLAGGEDGQARRRRSRLGWRGELSGNRQAGDRLIGQAAGMASGPGSRAPRLAESARVEAFSDGVFAVALTLLVLDLRSPGGEGGFAHALLSQWPACLAYLAAFRNIAAIWVSHHELFTLVRQVDARVTCASLLLLLVASLFPWPAAVISAAVRDGSHDDQVAATVLDATVGFLVPLAWIVLYRYLSRAPHLLTDPAAAGYARLGARRSLASVVV
jgi:uncharacterized membrane protein